jgi:MFS family permease
VTTTFLVATVAVELIAPQVVRRTGQRSGLALGLLALGLPALWLLPSTPGMPTMLTVSAVRGIGFALAVVAGGALTASLLPATRRGEGLAIIGIVNGAPAMIALPAGVWIAHRYGYPVVFLTTALIPTLSILTVPFLRADRSDAARPDAAWSDAARSRRRRSRLATRPRSEHGAGTGHLGVIAGLRRGNLRRPALVFAASAGGAGVLATFLPLSVPARLAGVVPAALFAHSVTATAAKWVVGRLGDRHGHQVLLAPGVALSALGLAAIAVNGSPAVVLAGSALFGAGFGTVQNATLTLMYSDAGPGGYSTVTAIWNAAYDGGMAAGAFGVGLLVPVTGYGPAFLVAACVLACALTVGDTLRGGRNAARSPKAVVAPAAMTVSATTSSEGLPS